MKKLFPLFILFVLISCNNQQEQSKETQLAGMYRLLMIQVPDSTGGWQEENWAKGGESYILYDGKGHMMVQITPRGYQEFQWMKEEDAIDAARLKAKTDSMSETELKAAVNQFASCYTYVADYTIDSNRVITHHRLASSIPDIWHSDVKRGFEFKGDTLILQNLATRRKLLWRRED